MKEKIPTTYHSLCLPVPVMVGLRKMAHDRKCTVSHLIRQMIYHHLDYADYSIYVGRPPRHKLATGIKRRPGLHDIVWVKNLK